ncbi:PREDICTED: uncharacterized protein LOC109465595 [Branchiostoma belcheri]|uniref:Uncharacterized protein LOC109465595 n=1 Tax=Branchiostoma belcheri TaxID=7741 RepID=A0A6P4YMW3_BRABE|nr:PREDICTED: uncharacterized protein LOC109465595 [Branchiostoma belcheri]
MPSTAGVASQSPLVMTANVTRRPSPLLQLTASATDSCSSDHETNPPPSGMANPLQHPPALKPLPDKTASACLHPHALKPSPAKTAGMYTHSHAPKPSPAKTAGMYTHSHAPEPSPAKTASMYTHCHAPEPSPAKTASMQTHLRVPKPLPTKTVNSDQPSTPELTATQTRSAADLTSSTSSRFRPAAGSDQDGPSFLHQVVHASGGTTTLLEPIATP